MRRQASIRIHPLRFLANHEGPQPFAPPHNQKIPQLLVADTPLDPGKLALLARANGLLQLGRLQPEHRGNRSGRGTGIAHQRRIDEYRGAAQRSGQNSPLGVENVAALTGDGQLGGLLLLSLLPPPGALGVLDVNESAGPGDQQHDHDHEKYASRAHPLPPTGLLPVTHLRVAASVTDRRILQPHLGHVGPD